MIGILKSQFINYNSVCRTLDRLGCDYILVKETKNFSKVDKFIIPGVGSYDNLISDLNDTGLSNLIKSRLLSGSNFKILGICVGFQILFESSDEGSKAGLGLFKGHLHSFNFDGLNYAPNVGLRKVFGYFNGDFYFMHSYYLNKNDIQENVSFSESHYKNISFISAIKTKNIWGTQFHPERSGSRGLNFISSFINS